MYMATSRLLRSSRLGLLGLLTVAATTITPQLAQATGECYWFTADEIVGQCSTPETSGRLFKPAAVGLALSCGAAECQGARGPDCIEFGVGPQSAQPSRWVPDSDFDMDMAMAWVTNFPTPGYGTLATSGAAGPGSPFDACEAVLKDAAEKLGY